MLIFWHSSALADQMRFGTPSRAPQQATATLWRRPRRIRYLHALPALAGLIVLVACRSDAPTQVIGRTVPPPPPQAPTDTAVAFDLRFKGVGVVSSDSGWIGSMLDFRGGEGYPNGSGTPLSIGPGICVLGAFPTCSWAFETFFMPPADTGLYTNYRDDFLSSLPTYLDTTSATDTVITSLDVEPANGLFGVAEYATTQPGSYVLAKHLVAPAALQAAATQEAGHSRVITALSFASGQIMYLSYGWQHDSATVYDAQVSTATVDSVAIAAQTLAAGGYTITAFGGDTADGFVVIGTRVHGVATPRTMHINSGNGTPPVAGLDGYAVVAYVVNAQGLATLIGEK
jgi:uncharacterized protein (DUF2141 family)